MAFAALAIPELVEVGGLAFEGVEGLLGVGEAASAAAEGAAVTGSETMAATATNIGVQATTATELTTAGTAAESSALGGTEGTSFLSRLPKLTPKSAAIGATVGGVGIYHLGKDMHEGHGLVESIENIPGHYIQDTSKLASGFGGGAGQIISAGIGGASKEVLGSKDAWMGWGMAALAAYWFINRS